MDGKTSGDQPTPKEVENWDGSWWEDFLENLPIMRPEEKKDDAGICSQYAAKGHCVKGRACRRQHVRSRHEGSLRSNPYQPIFVSAIEDLNPLNHLNSYSITNFCVSEGQTYVLLKEDLKSYPESFKFFQDLQSPLLDIDLRPLPNPPGYGELVLIKRGIWRRSRCIKHYVDRSGVYKFLNVDTGDFFEAKLSELKEVPTWCARPPFFARNVRIFNWGFDKNFSMSEKVCQKLVAMKLKLNVVGEELCPVVRIVDGKGLSVVETLKKLGLGAEEKTICFHPDNEFFPG